MRGAIRRPTGERRVRFPTEFCSNVCPTSSPQCTFSTQSHSHSLSDPSWGPPRGLRIPPARPPWAHTGRPNRGLQKEKFSDEWEMPRHLRLGGVLGPSWSRLKPSCGRLGPSWGASWAVLGGLGGLLGRLGASESRKGENAKHFQKLSQCDPI